MGDLDRLALLIRQRNEVDVQITQQPLLSVGGYRKTDLLDTRLVGGSDYVLAGNT